MMKMWLNKRRRGAVLLGIAIGTTGAIAWLALSAQATRPHAELTPRTSSLHEHVSMTTTTTMGATPADSEHVAPRVDAHIAPNGSVTGIEPLRTAFASDDDARKIAAIEDVVRDGVLPALPLLASIELRGEPEAAPTVIHAVANLAVQGGSQDRSLGVRTLSRWLRDEGEREHLANANANANASDAAGNVPNLVEAIGEIGGRDAVDTLMSTLDVGEIDLSVQTLAVQKLGELGDPRATASITRFKDRVESLSSSSSTRAGDDDDEIRFERQLRAEALGEAKKAIARLSTR